MDEASLHEVLSGRRRDVGACALRGGLAVASCGYSSVMRLRNAAYDRHWFRISRAKVPVISLGNITTGGTGKTPMAAWLANWLVDEGHRPGLLSRGYRSLELEGGSAGVSPSQSAGNDEKLVLDRLCPGVPHLQQRDRVSSAQRLVSEFGCNVLILDDGFQHRRLHRDLNVVLVDALQPWGYGHVLPRGLLREPMSGLRRADLIVLTRADQVSADAKQRIKDDLQRFRGTAECVEVAFAPQRLVGLDGSSRDLQTLAGSKAFAFCGIGNPAGFQRTVGASSSDCEFRTFPDHYHYRSTDMVDLAAQANRASAAVVLTTLKDLVKIEPSKWDGPPLYAVDVGVQFLEGQGLLTERLRRLFASAGAGP